MKSIPNMLKFIILSFIFLSCNTSGTEMKNDNQVDMVSGLTYLALGDSYTIGESVPESERWPVLLASKATDEGIAIQSPEIIATTGWTTDELQSGIQNANITGNNYDLVSLLIGVNNQYRGYDIDVFRSEFEALLKQAIGFAAEETENVLVVSIPDWGAMPFAEGRDKEKISDEIDQYNAIKEEIAGKYDVVYLDITGISREAQSDPSLVASDNLHPSGKMYGRWVEEVIFPWLSKKNKD